MVGSVGDTQICGEKACRSTSASHILVSFLKGHCATLTGNGDDTGLLVHCGLKAKRLYAFQKMSGIVTEQYASQSGSALR